MNRQAHSQEELTGLPADATGFPTLQSAFGVDSLGDGNRMAGINQLSAMAIVLANLASPGSCIMTKEGRRLEVGCSLLSSGPLVTGSILDEIVTPVRRCQDTLLEQLSRLLKADKAEGAREADRRWNLNSNPKQSAGEADLFDLMAGDPDIGPLFASREDQWANVVTAAPSECIDDLIRCPRVFIAAPKLKLLEQQMAAAHRRQALVAINLNKVTDVAKFSGICPTLIDGLIPGGPSGETISGRLLVLDSSGLLREAITADNDKSAWLNRLLWLVEGNAGPELPPQTEDKNTVSLTNLHERFERAVQRDFANRVNTTKPEPIVYKCDFSAIQARWMCFLTNGKSSCEITTAAKGLLPSLVFGLRRLVAADAIPSGFHYPNEDVEALARLLAKRMINHRASLLFSAAEARRMKDKRRILNKLAEGAFDTRLIYHHLRLQADYCRELLSEMKADNIVECCGYYWNRIEGRSLMAKSNEHLQLEV